MILHAHFPFTLPDTGMSSSMPSSRPQPMAVVAVIPNRLSLVSLRLREAQR